MKKLSESFGRSEVFRNFAPERRNAMRREGAGVRGDLPLGIPKGDASLVEESPCQPENIVGKQTEATMLFLASRKPEKFSIIAKNLGDL